MFAVSLDLLYERGHAIGIISIYAPREMESSVVMHEPFCRESGSVGRVAGESHHFPENAAVPKEKGAF
jgi:hypothetical protein